MVPKADLRMISRRQIRLGSEISEVTARNLWHRQEGGIDFGNKKAANNGR